MMINRRRAVAALAGLGLLATTLVGAAGPASGGLPRAGWAPGAPR
ncbi:hypothetical protein ACFQZ4_02200 [Catellatospora coxensis]